MLKVLIKSLENKPLVILGPLNPWTLCSNKSAEEKCLINFYFYKEFEAV
jgi:hypothetical protein